MSGFAYILIGLFVVVAGLAALFGIGSLPFEIQV